MPMERSFRMKITSQRRTQRHRLLELNIHPDEGRDAFFAVASLYASELYLNLPANPEANDFIEWLNLHIGAPVEPPIVKCSASWSESMVGPMQTVKWNLQPQSLTNFDSLLEQQNETGE